jgi:steroid 5-alpha reductase family enzyme
MTEIWISNLFLIAALMIPLWFWSLARKDASVVDPWWSIGFLLVTLQTGWMCGWAPGKTVLASLVTIWAVRLWAYLIRRNWNKGEDPRYTAFRERFGPERYWLVSLFQVFGLQGLLIWIISSPLRVAMAKPLPDPISSNDLAGALLVLVGLGFEAFGDAQLAQFKRIPENKGEVMDRGLWRYTRHPNYFGEAVLWWGFWLCSLDAPGALSTIYAPILMTFLLLKVSGVSLLERDLKKRKPEYEAYIKRTSAFIPWPPKAKETPL